MQRYITGSICAVSLIAATPVFAAAPLPASVDALVELLRSKEIITADELNGLKDLPGGELPGLVELLRGKNVLNDEEANKLLQQIAAPPQPEKKPEELVPEVVVPEEFLTPIPPEELQPTIELLRDQGVLGANEAEQIIERIGVPWSPTEERALLAPTGHTIEYHKTTLVIEGLLADLMELKRIKLITAEEEQRIKQRFLHKLSLERVTSGISEEVRQDIRGQVEARVPMLPDWVKRIRIAGDLRLRYQGDMFAGDNAETIPSPTSPTTSLNTSYDRQRLRIRGRLAVSAKINDTLETTIGLATGSSSDPVSTNTTLGDTFNKKNFLVDVAYLKWRPATGLNVVGGRFPSPWFSTDLVWDQDLNFEGAAVTYQTSVMPGLDIFCATGVFPLQELELSSRDKWLFGGQVGASYRISDQMSAKLAVAFYDFENITGVANSAGKPAGSTDWSIPQYVQKGNSMMYIDAANTYKTGLAAQFRELNITGSLTLDYWNPVAITLTGDYVQNLGFNYGDVKKRYGATALDETIGYQLGLTVGRSDVKEFGDWKAHLIYKYLEADAVLDAFTDSDFHLGGTNAKGWILGGDYGLSKNVWVGARWLTANEISGEAFGIDVIQLNLNARF